MLTAACQSTMITNLWSICQNLSCLNRSRPILTTSRRLQADRTICRRRPPLMPAATSRHCEVVRACRHDCLLLNPTASPSNRRLPWQRPPLYDVRTRSQIRSSTEVTFSSAFVYWQHSSANWDSCPTPAKSEGIEYLRSWPHRN